MIAGEESLEQDSSRFLMKFYIRIGEWLDETKKHKLGKYSVISLNYTFFPKKYSYFSLYLHYKKHKKVEGMDTFLINMLNCMFVVQNSFFNFLF